MKMYRLNELAEAIGVSRHTILNWTSRPFDPLPRYKISRKVTLFDADEVKEWLKRQSQRHDIDQLVEQIVAEVS